MKISHKELFRNKRKSHKTTQYTQDENDFLDIDEYFRRVMEQNINENEQQNKLSTTDFKRYSMPQKNFVFLFSLFPLKKERLESFVIAYK